jgi:hypothetical protein
MRSREISGYTFHASVYREMLFRTGIAGPGSKEKETEQADSVCVYDTFSVLCYFVSEDGVGKNPRLLCSPDFRGSFVHGGFSFHIQGVIETAYEQHGIYASDRIYDAYKA